MANKEQRRPQKIVIDYIICLGEDTLAYDIADPTEDLTPLPAFQKY
ncbi:hypothetical protein ACFL0S_13770 [Thermodesulfobacteriota bacterium]